MRYGNLELQTDKIITESVQHSQMANRIINSLPISRRNGNKFINDEFSTKTITIRGTIIADSPADLQNVKDSMQKELAISEQELIIDTGRTYYATCSRANFPELRYTKTAQPFDLEFFSSSPFSFGNTQTATFIIASGVQNQNIPITISGTAFVEPQVTLTYSGANTITKHTFYHLEKGTEVAVSGSFTSELVLNYENATVSNSGVLTDYTGQFSKWDSGVNNLTIELEGSSNTDINGSITYTPRYYH